MTFLSLADLVTRGVVSTASEATALALGVSAAVRERRGSNPLAATPDLANILLSSSGHLVLANVPTRDTPDDVADLAYVVRALLRLDTDAPSGDRPAVPGPLMVLIARALRHIDLPPPTHARFAEALAQFAGPDPVSVRVELFRRASTGLAAPTVHSPAPVSVRIPAAVNAPLFVRPPVPAVGVSRGMRELGRRLGAATALLGAATLAALSVWTPLYDATPAPPPIAPIVQPRDSVADRRTLRASATVPPAIEQATTDGATAVPATTDTATAASKPSAPASSAPRALLTAAMVGRDVFSPSFGPAGRSLYFHAGRDGSPLMRASLEHGAVTQVMPILEDGASNYHVVASPDGTLIAFDSDRDGERGVYVARADGSGAVRVSGDHFASIPSWAPDGRRVAFVRSEPGRSRVWNIWIADIRAGTLVRATRHTVGQPWGASWFPDGRHVAYSREQQLVILDLTTGRSSTFASPVRGRLVRTPAVSPDGSRVVFQVYRDGVWMLDVRRRHVRRLFKDRSAEEFGWSPDGERIVFHARHGANWGVWTVRADS